MSTTDTQITDLGRHASAHLGDAILALDSMARRSEKQAERLRTLIEAVQGRRTAIDEQVAEGTFDIVLDSAVVNITEAAMQVLNTSVTVGRVETVITSANRARMAAATARALSAHV
jgi:hypothetical protein